MFSLSVVRKFFIKTSVWTIVLTSIVEKDVKEKSITVASKVNIINLIVDSLPAYIKGFFKQEECL